jgi:hypothetical protein
MLSGNLYLYLKTHKVGGTSISTMLTRALREQGVATCDGPHPSNGTCAACLWHETRSEIGAYTHGVRRGRYCPPLARALPMITVRTALVMREPIDRMWAMYHYARDDGWCQRRAKVRNRTCAAEVLPFRTWATPTDQQMKTRRLERPHQTRIVCETMATLGGLGEAAPRVALRALRGLTVVGVTERLDDFVILLAEGWQLPLPLLARHYGHTNAHTVPRAAVSDRDRATLLASNPMLNHEQQLYKEATQLAAERARMVADLANMRRTLASLMPRAPPQPGR